MQVIDLHKIKPMLAETGKVDDLKKRGWIYEPKYDGTRAIVYNVDTTVRFLNRRSKWIEYRYPELYNVWRAIKAREVVLDAEIVVLDSKGRPDFSKLAEREHQESKLKIEILAKQMPATLIVFDILEKDEQSLMGRPLWERKKILETTIREDPTIRIAKSFWSHDGEAVWKAIKKLRLEGVMAKNSESPYMAGKRSDQWLKIKALKSLDVVIGGYTVGEGGRTKTFGALLCGVYYKGNLAYIGRVGTGWDQRQLQEFSKVLKSLETKNSPFPNFSEAPEIVRKVRWVKPELVAEVRFMSLSSDLKMRAPVFKYFRVDKAAEECVLEEAELRQLRSE